MSNARQCFLTGLVFPLGCCLIAAASMWAQADSSANVPGPEAAAKLHPALLRLVESTSEPVKAWVFFVDKGVRPGAEYEAAIQRVAAGYNPRASQRRLLRGRAARLGQPLFDQHDLPVVQDYVDAVEATGARVRVTSRWVNAVSVYATCEQLERIAALSCVTKLQPVARSRRPEILDPQELGDGPFLGGRTGGLRTLDYGAATAQLSQINLIGLHDEGYTGQGIIVGILDTGFQRSHDAFNNPDHPLAVVAEYDFVDDDDDTSYELGDPASQHNHGTMILGVLGAYMPGELIGGAYDASFVLAKTEDTTDEYPAEEDNFVAGLEFIEGHGADLTTSSLGYIDWYTQEDLDGMTAVTTIAVNIMTSLGVHHCNAAGNNYHDSDPGTSSLIAPSDAFQGLGCGAVSSTGSIASFSSDGPTADGRVKPEVLARGVSTSTVSPTSDTGYTTASGTSLSTPLVACAVACLTHSKPWWTVDQMREQLFETADYYVTHGTYDPLYVYGYGVVDALGAHSAVALTILLPDGTPWRLDPHVPTPIAVQIQDGGETVVPGSETLHYRYDPGAPEFLTVTLTPLGESLYEATLPAADCDATPEFYFSATGGGGTTVTDPPTAPLDVYSAVVATMTVFLEEDFESDQGWTVEDIDVEDGTWERGVPAGYGDRGDPTTDHDGSGQCYLTGNEPGNSDVDGGPTRLTSPAIDVSGFANPILQYARWFTNDDEDEDRLEVEISDDDGASWHLIEAVPHSEGWVEREVNVVDYVEATSQVKVRFSAMDNPNNSKTEGGLDAVSIFDLSCFAVADGDFDGDGDVDLDDFASWDDCMTGPDDPPYGEGCDAFDFDTDYDVDLTDFAAFVWVFTG